MVKPWWRETIETIVWALVLAFLLRTFVIQAFWIPSGSMIPTLEPGDRVIVLKFWYSLPGKSPERGDIVVFKYPVDPRRDFIKRVIGISGDVVEMREGRVFINHKEISEPYVQNLDSYEMEALSVPPNQLFCLGDNRPNSQDGRFWGFVPMKYLRGPALFRYWPPSRVGVLR